MGNFIKMGMSVKGGNKLIMVVSGYKYVIKDGVKPLFYSKMLPYLRRREALIFQRGDSQGAKKPLSGATKILYKRQGINRRRALEPHGELYDSLMGRGRYQLSYIGKFRLTYGTKYPPGFFIQHGAKIKTTDKMVSWFWAHGIHKSNKSIVIPPRPFLYVDSQMLRDLDMMTVDFFERMNKHLLYYEPAGPFRWLPR